MNDAELYNGFNMLQRRDAERVVADNLHLMSWKHGDRVLDVGSGDGNVLISVLMPKISGDIASITGSDVSEKMVKYATATYQMPKVDFRVLDVSVEIPIQEHHGYDHVFSFNCLHWVQDQRTAIGNIFNLLKPGGDCLFSLFAKNKIYDVYKIMRRNPKWAAYMKDMDRFLSPYHESVSPPDDLKGILESVGFTKTIVEYKEDAFYFNDVKSLKKSVFAVNPFLPRIPKQMHEDYFEDYIAEVKNLNLFEEDNNNYGDNVKIKAPYHSLVAYASK